MHQKSLLYAVIAVISPAFIFAESPMVRIRVGPDISAPAIVEWTDPTNQWTLQRSFDLNSWQYVNADQFAHSPTHTYSFTETMSYQVAFYRLRAVGQRRLFVVGDSISTPENWPKNLATITGLHTFTQAIGGTTSPSMVSRANGLELAYPIPKTHSPEPGPVHIRWHRYIADRTHSTAYRSLWANYSKTVSEPNALEVYNNGHFVGLATRSLKKFSTDYANDKKRIICTGHGLKDGERVVFISDDPSWPSDLSVRDNSATWSFSSSLLPPSIIERRVYFVANALADSFEISELQGDVATIDLGRDAVGSNHIECGWTKTLDYAGGAWQIDWRTRTKYDDWIWLLEVSANDVPSYSVSTLTIPNTELLLDRLVEINPRFVIVCPPSGSGSDRGPGSFNWTNYFATYIPWVRTHYPENHIDTMTLLGTMRSQKELGFLADPAEPELLWIRGDPRTETSWEASTIAFEGAYQRWVGPGYLPLQFRYSFADGIHMSAAGNQALAEAVAAFINAKGW